MDVRDSHDHPGENSEILEGVMDVERDLEMLDLLAALDDGGGFLRKRSIGGSRYGCRCTDARHRFHSR